MKSSETQQELLQSLSSQKLLQGIGISELESLSRHLQEVIWPKHSCTKWSYQKDFYFIIAGRVKIFKVDFDTGREMTLFLLQKSDAFDLFSLFDQGSREVYYEALDRVRLYSLPISRMKKILSENQIVNRNMFSYLAARMRLLEKRTAEIVLIDIATRLARLITQYVNQQSMELELIQDLPDEELASLIGSTRAVVNRHLQEFKNQGIIDRQNHVVRVKNLPLLLSKAGL